MKQGELASKSQMPWQMKWTGGTIPMPVMEVQGSGIAEATREAFHMMADANMKSLGKSRSGLCGNCRAG